MAEFTDDDVARLAEILARDGVRWMSEISLAIYLVRGEGVTLPPPPPDPERSDAEVLADLVALSDAGQVQIHMTHVDEGLPVYEVSWRKPGWSPPPHGPDIAAAGRSLGWPVARVLEMAQPHINPPPDPAVVVAEDLWEAAQSGDLYAVVRDLFTTDALEAAAAKVQEAET